MRSFALLLAVAGCAAGDPLAVQSTAVTADGDCSQVVKNPNSGPELRDPRVVNIYWGAEWTSGTAQKNAQSLDDFTAKLVANPFYMTYLFQYYVRSGVFAGSTTVSTNPPATNGKLADANAMGCGLLTSPVLSLIGSLYGAANGNKIEAPTANTLYVVYLPSTVQSQYDVCNKFAGHHYFGTDSQNNSVNYAIVENSSLDGMTALASHEIAEALTDPTGSSWRQVGNNNEIGDICQGNAWTKIDGYQIEQYWSNRYCRCVRPEGLDEADHASQLALDGGRIGVIVGGEAYVKDNDLDGGWQWESSGVVQIALDRQRIGVVKSNGDVYVKDGALDAPWTLESSGCSQLAMNDGRIGVVKTNGDAYVKEGALDAPWTLESSGVGQLVLAGTRIGVVQPGRFSSYAWVKDGALDAQWTLESRVARQLALSYDRIGVIARDGTLWVKSGALDAPWVNESSGVVSVALDRWRIGIVQASGAAYVKHGALDAPWFRLSDVAKRIVMPGNAIGYAELFWYRNNLDALPGVSNRVGVIDANSSAWVTDAGW